MYLRFILIIVLYLGWCLDVMGQNAADLGESNIYRLQGEGMELAIDGNVGARAVSFKLDGTEIFGSRALHPNSYGSTLWLGPQGKWKGHKVLDASPYSLGSYNQRERQPERVYGFQIFPFEHAGFVNCDSIYYHQHFEKKSGSGPLGGDTGANGRTGPFPKGHSN